ncbi:hypothetical protein [Patulibacter minatonensis]|uniref:hypothetical protein n=1 Tax=Patulibacter minatonensis TaxID=298163 RepID=UPI00047C1E84|nr:hypothetical protein [Patulibacter minatonensis]
MPRYVVGQHVELLPEIPSPEGGTILPGTEAVVREVDTTTPNFQYLVVFIDEGHPNGELVWLGENDIVEAG